MLALGVYEAGICSCGVHSSLAEDKANTFTFEQRTCPVCRGSARYGRMLAAQDATAMKVHGDQPAPEVVRPSDGRHVYVRQMTALEVAERRERVRGRSPEAADRP